MGVCVRSSLFPRSRAGRWTVKACACPRVDDACKTYSLCAPLRATRFIRSSFRPGIRFEYARQCGWSRAATPQIIAPGILLLCVCEREIENNDTFMRFTQHHHMLDHALHVSGWWVHARRWRVACFCVHAVVVGVYDVCVCVSIERGK